MKSDGNIEWLLNDHWIVTEMHFQLKCMVTAKSIDWHISVLIGWQHLCSAFPPVWKCNGILLLDTGDLFRQDNIDVCQGWSKTGQWLLRLKRLMLMKGFAIFIIHPIGKRINSSVERTLITHTRDASILLLRRIIPLSSSLGNNSKERNY